MSIKDLSDAELEAKMSQRLLWLEHAYKEAAGRVDEMAGGDQVGDLAKAALRLKGIHYSLKALHTEASIAACMIMGTPMPKSGER